jgi:uncharacterized protein YdhG (YjbR/CyaY superfamily)
VEPSLVLDHTTTKICHRPEGDWFLTGFSPRKKSLSISIMPGVKMYGALLKKPGKYKTGVSCLYINQLADIDTSVLKELIETALEDLKKITAKRGQL